MRQQLYLEQKHGTPTENGGCMFWLQDPVICPSREWQLTCTVVDGSSCTNSRTRATVRAISRIFFRLRSQA